jgi:hypothetical protein
MDYINTKLGLAFSLYKNTDKKEIEKEYGDDISFFSQMMWGDKNAQQKMMLRKLLTSSNDDSVE